MNWQVEWEKCACRKTSHRSGAEVPEGYAEGKLLASYVHLYFAAKPEIVERFVNWL